VREVIAAFNRGGVEAALAYFDPHVEWIGPPEWLEERLYRGHEGIRKVASLWTEHFDEFRLDLDRTIDCGDHVLALLYQRARIKGSEDEIEQLVAQDYELRDGLATRVHVYFSWEAALKATGLEG
jgi:ketosteroid isomerase-like protein